MTTFLQELFSNFPIIISIVMSAMLLALMVDSFVGLLRHTKEKPEAPPGVASVPAPATVSPVSALAGLSFLCGLGAVCLVTASAIAAMCVSMSEVTQIPADANAAVDLAARITLFASLLPAVGAVAFGLAARGSLAENRSMRGRSLYRSGLLLAVLSAVLVFDARIVSPSAWTASGRHLVGKVLSRNPAQADRVYLGVVHQSSSDAKGNRVLQVLPGSPAEKAGLQNGDVILDVNGTPLGANESIAERIVDFRPGTRMTLGVRRGEQILSLEADLASSFATLLELLEDQARDDERLDVLKAAGLDRRFTADELTRICKAFDWDDGRLKAIKPALPLLVDPKNAIQILGAIERADAKKEVSEWIAARSKPPK
jgi:hypothetical protein